MQFFRKPFIRFIVYVLVFIGLFYINILLGLGALAAYILYRLYVNRAGVMSLIGRFNYARGNMDRTLVWFERAYRSGAAKPKNIISYAYLLLKSGNTEKSEDIFNSLMGRVLDNDDKMLLKSNMALVLWKKGRLDDAVAMLEEVFADFKTSAIYGSLGYLLILKGDLQKALEFNREAYDYNSQNAVIADNLGQNYYLMGEYERAREVYEALMPKKPDFPEPYYNYGLVLAAMGSREKALEHMHKALEHDFSFLSSVSREEVERTIKELSAQ